MDYNNTRAWWYLNGKASVCWGVAHALYWYLKINEERKINAIKGLEIQDVHELEIGDLIFYENRKNIIFHATMVTSFIQEQGDIKPRISQHSYDQLNETYEKNYDYKKAHFLKISL